MRWAARYAPLAVCATVLLVGCGVRGNGPEPLPLDRVDCARCGMLISSDANAAEAIVPGAGTRFYDDIGCMAGDPAAVKAGVERFVRLADGTGWIPADAAYFAEITRHPHIDHFDFKKRFHRVLNFNLVGVRPHFK